MATYPALYGSVMPVLSSSVMAVVGGGVSLVTLLKLLCLLSCKIAMGRNLLDTYKLAKIVFSRPRYLAVGILVAFIIFTFSVYLPNLELLGRMFNSARLDFNEKFVFFWQGLGAFITNTTPFSAGLIALNSLLFGINAAFLSFVLSGQRRQVLARGGATSLGALLVGMLGIGCASCGAILLTPLLALLGAAGALSFFPLGGQEFAVLSVVLLSISLFYLSKQAFSPFAKKT